MVKKKTESELLYELTSHSRQRLSAFKEIPINQRGFILLALSKRVRVAILTKLKDNEIVNLLHYLDPDEVTDLLQNLETHHQNNLIKKLNANIREKVEFLLRFDPKTAAGIMSLDYIEITNDLIFESVSKIIQKHESRTGKFPTLLVVSDGFLVGELSGHVLPTAKPNEKINKYVRRVPTVRYNQNENEIIKIFKKHPHNKIVVLDEDSSILGVIYSDDILTLIQKQSTNNLYNLAGVHEEEDVLDPAWVKVKYRYGWLIINLATAFLAAFIVSLFQNTISAFVLLAVYMPIVAGMGGNAATQTLAVVVRGLALKEIEWGTGKKVIINEVIAGGVNGIINGIIVAIIAVFWNKSPLLGFVTGIAMIFNLIVAGFFGAIVPLIMKKLGKDPAASATIFITTATDVLGFLAFLGLASIMIGK